ncbi:Ankyrin repeat-containing domain [Trichophyton rubrum]|nr:Ankyrin repeat-containing domain [Trichophyton rubrum]
MLRTNSTKKAFTCFYWVNGGCKHSADQCKFVHEYTDRVAKPPKPPRYASAWREDRPETKNLIDLLSAGSETSDSKELDSVDTSNQTAEATRPSQIVCRAIESGHDYDLIKELLTNYSQSGGGDTISPEEKLDILLSVIACSRTDLVDLVIENGADPNGTVHNSEIPLLASAILNRNSTSVSIVKLLLAAGADPNSIPKSLWEHGVFTYQSPEPDNDDELMDSGLKALKDTLEESVNVSIRHCLFQATRTLPPLPASVEMYLLPFIKRITRAEHLLIGQRTAIKWVRMFIIMKFMTRTNSPLVMAFVGPAGHGKSSLAKELGTFIPISNLQRVDPDPGEGEDEELSNDTSPTNAPGELEVIFVDKGDKAEYQRVLSFLEGEDAWYYLSEGEKVIIDRSNTLCIIAASSGEDKVMEYYDLNSRELEVELADTANWESRLHRELELFVANDLEKEIGTSLAGHVSCYIPFTPFSKTEAAVLAHSYLLKATDSLAEFHDSLHHAKLGESDNVTFILDAQVEACDNLATTVYVIKLGARSIEQGVFKAVQSQMVQHYLKSDLLKENRGQGENVTNASDRCVTITVGEDFAIRLE